MSSRSIARINWVLDPGKFLSLQEAKKLLKTAKERAETAMCHGQKVAIRDYFIIDLALSTGLRVMEIANLKCGDVFIQDDMCSLLVQNGKGGKKRLVWFNGSFRYHFIEYIRWKQAVGEPTSPSDPLLLSSNTDSHMSTRAIPGKMQGMHLRY